MIPTLKDLKAISGGSKFTSKTVDNMNSIIHALEKYGVRAGLDLPHRTVHFLCQVAHESGAFKFDREIWGNTPAQQRYDVRTDLGNTPERDGDGKLYMGRSGIQLTGKANYIAFTQWAKKMDPTAPDFVTHPELINTDPWEGLVPIWYWAEGNPTGKSLNRYADVNDIETITKRINGGLNGFQDRIKYYTRACLVFLGYSVTSDQIEQSIRDFQQKRKLTVDGDAGPRTRAAFHEALVAVRKDVVNHYSIPIAAAPVTEKVEVLEKVAVTPAKVDKPGLDIGALATTAAGGIAAGNISAGGVIEATVGLDPKVQIALVVLLGLVVVGVAAYFIIGRLNLAREAKEIKAEVNAFNRSTHDGS